MSAADMKDLMNKMQQVREPGLYNPNATGSAGEGIKHSRDKMSEAIGMYENMINQGKAKQELKEDVKKIGTFDNTDQLKVLGAVQAIKELVEGAELKKENSQRLLEQIKKITDCFG